MCDSLLSPVCFSAVFESNSIETIGSVDTDSSWDCAVQLVSHFLERQK